MRVAVAGDALHDRRAAGLLLDGVLEVALEERVLLEVAVGARRRVAAVEADRLVRPLARQAEVAPGADVLVAPPLRVLEKIASTCWSVRLAIGLSLWT